MPTVRVVSPVEADDPRQRMAIRELVAAEVVDGIEDDSWDLVELERRLMAPYITRAGEHRVELGWSEQGGAPLVVHERRAWDSLLAPVYVQLLEGLRRVSEGQRGAAFCKECRLPFLTLDARRSAFCSDRHRLRYGQRDHRRRAREAELDA
jgi:hypothetical protein